MLDIERYICIFPFHFRYYELHSCFFLSSLSNILHFDAHLQRIMAINAQYEEQLAALRARHAGRRDELLQRESSARQHQYQKGIMDHYMNGGIGPGDPRGNSGVTNLPAAGQAHQNYESEHFDSFRERARFLGNSGWDPNLDARGAYPGGRVYDTGSRYY